MPPRAKPLTSVYALDRRREKARESRCCAPADPPLAWHDYYVHNNDKIREIRQWFLSLPGPVQDRIAGELDDLFEQAALGRTDPAADEQPIEAFRLADDYFELRHTIDPATDGFEKKLFRHYHFEPSAPHESSLVALHAHFKEISGGSEAISQRQTAEMRYAVNRCDNGRSRSWGLPRDSGDLLDRLLDL